MWWPVTYALVAFGAGYFVYSRLERRFAEVL
jgi:hypothetical protein